MNVQTPMRLSAAEDVLVAQLESRGNSQAAATFKQTGLPTRRNEAYHYTDLKMAIREVPELASGPHSVGAPAFRLAGAYRVLMANGRFEQVGTAPAGIVIDRHTNGCLAQTDDSIKALNAAIVDETLVVRLSSSVDPVVHIDRRTSGPDQDTGVHSAGSLLIELEAGANGVVLETFSGSDANHLSNNSTRIKLGAGATLLHIVVDLSGPQVRHFHSSEYEILSDARLRTLYMHCGSALSRSQLTARFEGPDAHADFTGLNLVNKGQHCDFTLDVTHAVPNTTSIEAFKSVVHEGAKAIFQGKINVAKDAQKTDAKMMAEGLMLADSAEIFMKPELEIFADDVQCGHGSTCGELDNDALFYLMSRGIPRDTASAMLIRAFVQELLDPIEDENLNEALHGVVNAWLEQDDNLT